MRIVPLYRILTLADVFGMKGDSGTTPRRFPERLFSSWPFSTEPLSRDSVQGQREVCAKSLHELREAMLTAAPGAP